MENVISINPDIMHGTPCFAKTRVPVQTLFDHQETGYSIDGVLEQFPSVRREQVVAVLNQLKGHAERSAARATG